MFLHQSVVCACAPLLLRLVSSQSYFHTKHGAGGSFTSISHGAGLPHQGLPVHHQALPVHHQGLPVHHQGLPVHHQGLPVHHQGLPVQHQATHQPLAHHTQHHHQAPAYHAPVPTLQHDQLNYGEQCLVETVSLAATVCLPAVESQCEQEEGGEELVLRTEEDCQEVVRTVCTERFNVADNEVCAYTYTLQPVDTEARLVEPRWDEVCHQNTICLNPQHRHNTGYGAPSPAYCHEETHETCALEPRLEVSVRPLTVSLPRPVEVCINKQVVLPFLECEKVKDRQCLAAARAGKGRKYQIDQCTLGLGEPVCQETHLQLPRQACLKRVEKVKTVYTAEEVSYSG